MINENCSSYCKSINVPLIGSVKELEKTKTFGGYILIKKNSPWEPKIENTNTMIRTIYERVNEIQNKQNIIWKLQLISDDNDEIESIEHMHAIFYRNIHSKGIIGNLKKETYKIPFAKLADNFENIMLNENTEFLVNNEYERDVLVCNHSRRDICCGKYGYPIYKYLKNLSLEKVKIWRTSHIGGHRTAPTMVEFPEARYWGYLTNEIAKDIVTKEFTIVDIFDKHYRGRFGMKNEEQIIDLMGLNKFGVKWHSNNLSIFSELKNKKIIIKMKSHLLEIKKILQKEPMIIEVGETKCQIVKPINLFKEN